MARPLVADRVKETTQTTGTGTLSLAGNATGFQSFVSAIGTGKQCPYVIVDDPTATTEWEVGIGTVTAGTPNTLSRDRVIASSNSGSKVSWSSGTKTVIVAEVSEALNTIIDTVDSDLVTTGTSTAYVLATNRPAVGLYEGRFICFRLHTTSGAAPTINVDASGAVAFVDLNGTAVPTGSMVLGAYYWCKYKSSTGKWMVFSPFGFGAAASKALGADITTDGTNLTAKKVVVQKTTDYNLAATDRNTLINFYATSATATATCLAAATAGNGYSVEILNLFASTKSVVLAVASGQGFYHPNGSNTATVTLLPGESCAVTSSGTYYFISEVTRNKTSIQGGFKTLKIVAADGTTAPVVTADQVTVEDTSGRAMRLSSLNVTMNLGTTGAGGLDTGTIAAAKMYFIWAIAKEDGTQSALASLSSTAPSPMPTGYTMMARIGTVVTKQGAATLLGTVQYGRSVQYAQPLTIASGVQGTYSATAPTWAAKTVAANSGASAFVPLTASKIVLMVNGNLASGTSQFTYAAPNSGYGGYQSSNPPPFVAGVSNGATAFGSLILESATIQVIGNGTQSAVYCNGWEENF